MRLARSAFLAVAIFLLAVLFFVSDAQATSTNAGTNDICYSETTSLTSAKTGGVTNKAYSKGTNFNTCEQQKVTKADCSNAQKKSLVGTETYTDANGKTQTLNRCDTLAGSNTYCIGDSNAANMQLIAGCPAGTAVYGDKPNQVLSDVSNTNIQNPQNATVVLSSGCTNETSDDQTCLNNCSVGDPTNISCPINQQIQALKNAGVPSQNIYCMGSGGSDAASLDSITSSVCGAQGANYLGALQTANPGDFHAIDQNYLDMAGQVGQFEQPPANLAAGVTSLSTPFEQQGSYDQIRSLVGGVCNSNSPYDCTQFQNSMIAVCQQESSCTADAVSSAGCVGAFQICPSSQSYWEGQGVSNYIAACDPSTDACQQVTSQCAGDGNLNNFTCNSAGAIGMHMQLEPQIQAVSSDPATQAAIHEMYGLSPNQVVSSLNSSDPLNASIAAGSKNFSANGMILPTNATLTDGVNAILSKGTGLQTGLSIATGGSSGLPTSGNAGTFTVGYGTQQDFGGSDNIAGPSVSKSSGTFNVTTGSSNSLQNQLTQMMLINSLMGPLKTLMTGLTPSTQSTAAQTPPPAPPPPTASVSALPNPVKRGTPLYVSWSSNGTSLTQVCQVVDQSGAIIGSGDSGSQTITTGTTTPSTLTYTATCYGVNGQSVQQQTSVTVQ